MVRTWKSFDTFMIPFHHKHGREREREQNIELTAYLDSQEGVLYKEKNWRNLCEIWQSNKVEKKRGMDRLALTLRGNLLWTNDCDKVFKPPLYIDKASQTHYEYDILFLSLSLSLSQKSGIQIKILSKQYLGNSYILVHTYKRWDLRVPTRLRIYFLGKLIKY